MYYKNMKKWKIDIFHAAVLRSEDKGVIVIFYAFHTKLPATAKWD